LDRLFKHVRIEGAQKTEAQDGHGNSSSGAVCGATPQMNVFRRPAKTIEEWKRWQS